MVKVRSAISSKESMEETPPVQRSFAISAAPMAPIKPASAGRITSRPDTSSKQRNIASLKNVPPCAMICSPSCAGSVIRITLNNAFFTTEYASPAAISSTAAPSFCACFTLEFIKMVHRVPRSSGILDFRASSEKLLAVYPMESAKFSIKEPHPEEHASFSRMESTLPFLIRMHFISCPPISMMQSASGSTKRAA